MNTRRPTRSSKNLLLVLAALGLGACAPAGLGTAERNATLIVMNNLEPPTTVEVFVDPSVGPRESIGRVPSGVTVSLGFIAPEQEATLYRFVVEAEGMVAIATEPIAVADGSTIVWDVGTNVAAVVGTP
jgi:hypothetical protein